MRGRLAASCSRCTGSSKRRDRLSAHARSAPLALRRAKANVVGLVGLVENMPDGRAQRPGDVVRSLKGAHPLADVSISVNLSAAQLSDPALVPDIEALLARTGMPAHRLELEITESQLMDNADAAAAPGFHARYAWISSSRTKPFPALRAAPSMRILRMNGS